MITSRPRTPAHRIHSAGRLLPVLAATLLLLTACSGAGPSAEERPRQAEVPVVVATAVARTVPVELHAIGTVEAYSSVQVKAQVGGELTSVLFNEGDDVRKGQTLFTIDPRPYQAMLDQARSNLAKDAAQARNAEAEGARTAALFQRGIVSREQNDQAQAAAEAARSAAAADQAAVENASLQLSYCTITSPIDGRAGSLLVHAGNLVKPNDVPLVVINQIRPIYIDFSLPEQELGAVRRYMAARRLAVQATIPNETGAPVGGTLSFIDNAVDPATGTVKVKGTFANGDRRLWPGQFVDVNLTLAEQRNAILVPSQALQTGQNGQFVFLVRPNRTVEVRPIVSPRTWDGDAVVAKGLEAGDLVVTDGQLRLAPGAKVNIRGSGTPNAAPTTGEAIR